MQRILSHIFVVILCYVSVAGAALAQTKIYVKNQTDVDLRVISWSVGGDKVSKKAWKKGVKSIAPGERKSILTLIRSGKLNWMDPTPRFVEPGKTVTFHTEIVPADLPDDQSVTLLQKLFGEGKTTKMWYAIDGINEPVVWELQNQEYTKQWVTLENVINIVFKAFKEGKMTHVEYAFSYP